MLEPINDTIATNESIEEFPVMPDGLTIEEQEAWMAEHFPPPPHKNYVFPGTKSVFHGSEETAIGAGYIGLLDEEYEALMNGTMKWEGEILTPCEKEEEKPRFAPDYGRLVSRLIREKYSQDEVEAIIANYLDEPENAKYKAEFDAYNEYRAECKKKAREM